MSRSTPGPWEVLHDHPDPQTNASLAHIVGPGKDRWDSIACVFGCQDADARANARLIASAPELLEALKVCEQVLRGYDRYREDVNAHVAARAAIAKAEGQS